MTTIGHVLGHSFSRLRTLVARELPPGVSVGEHTYGHSSDTFRLHPGSDAVTVGKYCSIGTGVRIFGGGEHRTDLVTTYPLKTLLTRADGTNYDATTKGPTTIRNDVWIGTNALILSGVTIEDGAVIGAGSVVSSDVPPYAIASGNPARVTRLRFSPPQIQMLLGIAWWNWDDNTIKTRESAFYGDIETFLQEYGKGASTDQNP